MDIFRAQTVEEKKLATSGFKDVRKWRNTDIKQLASKKIAEVEYNCKYKKREPYCSKCAINEVDRKMDSVNKEIKKAEESGKIELKIDFDIEYEKFGGFDRFEEVDETEIQEDMIVSGIKQRVATGKYRNFICKTCNGEQSMEFKNKELEEERLKLKEGTERPLT